LFKLTLAKVQRYDALIVTQPSQTTPAELKNILDAIQAGQPTAIFEDPYPNPQNFRYDVRGTFQPRLFARSGPEQADLKLLLDALELNIDFATRGNTRSPYVLWHDESRNPYKANLQLNQEEQLIIQETRPQTDPAPPGVYLPVTSLARPIKSNKPVDLKTCNTSLQRTSKAPTHHKALKPKRLNHWTIRTSFGLPTMTRSVTFT